MIGSNSETEQGKLGILARTASNCRNQDGIKLALGMIFKSKTFNLDRALADLMKLAADFIPTQKGGRTPRLFRRQRFGLSMTIFAVLTMISVELFKMTKDVDFVEL